MKVIILMLVIAVVIGAGVGIAVGFGGLFGKQTVPPPPCELGMICVTAEQLCDDYFDSTIAADYMYKGKIIEVSGEVKDIGNVYGAAYLTLDCGVFTYVDLVWCYPDLAHESQLVPIRKGDLVSVRGLCIGKPFHASIMDGAIQLLECTSVKLLN
jgi:hypothetical protein